MFKNFMVAITALFVFAFSVSSANASVVTFDDIVTPTVYGDPIENGYSGFDWGNFNVLNTVHYYKNPSGYEAGTVSADNVAYNANSGNATISSSSAFNFNSAYFTGAWRDGLNITVIGYLDGVEQYSKVFQASSTAPSRVTFNWANIDSLLFKSGGGVENPDYTGSGAHFAMDNLDVSAVPVPAALPLFGFGLAGVSGLKIRRKRKEKVADCA